MKGVCYIALFILSLIAFSCTSEEDVDSSGHVVPVRFAPAMEMTQDEDVPSRSITDAPSIIYAMQIYSDGVPMYYGVFDEPDSMQIALSSGRSYSMKMAAYQSGTGGGLKYKNVNGKCCYYLPDEVELSNKFEEGALLTGINQISNCILSDSISRDYPEIDAFFTEKEFKISSVQSKVSFNLKRVSFAINISVKGLSSGKVVLSFDKQELVFTPQNNSYHSIRAFKGNEDGLAVVASLDTYYEEFPVVATWYSTNGTTISCNALLSLKRNVETPISINLNNLSSEITFEGWYQTTHTTGEIEKERLLAHISAGKTIQRIDDLTSETEPEVVFDNDSSVVLKDQRTAHITLGEDNYWYLNGTKLELKLEATEGSMSLPPDITIPRITLGINRHWYVDGIDCGIEAPQQKNEYLPAVVTAIYSFGNRYYFSFSDGSSAKTLKTFYNPYLNAGSIRLKGQLHCHTTNSSDGTLTPSELAARFKLAGYDFFTITDHDFITPEPLGNELIWLCKSYESTKSHHLCIYNAINVLKGNQSIKEVVDYHLANANTYVGLPHPNSLKNPVSDEEVVNECGRVSFVDVYNGTMNTSLGENGTRAFDLLLSNGHRVFATAVDDFHSENHIKRGWVEVLSQSRDSKDIMDALLKGAYFATNGAMIEGVDYTDNIVTVHTGSPVAVTRFYGYGGVQLGVSVVGETAAYALKGNEKYVRAEVEISKRFCWTQPIFIQ